MKAFSLRGLGFKRAIEATRPTPAATTFAYPQTVRVAKKRKWNISRAASFLSHRGGAPQPWEEAGEFDGSPTVSCRRGLAVAVAVLASSPLPEARA